jgi:hypothetical protein
MAKQPPFTIYDAQGQYLGRVKHAEDAAALVSVHGPGARVKWKHGPVLWREGKEEFSAAESYDLAGHRMLMRLSAPSRS